MADWKRRGPASPPCGRWIGHLLFRRDFSSPVFRRGEACDALGAQIKRSSRGHSHARDPPPNANTQLIGALYTAAVFRVFGFKRVSRRCLGASSMPVVDGAPLRVSVLS